MADGYQVMTQRQTIGRLPDDTYGPVMTITFRTVFGVVASIEVPAADYTLDRVRELIEAKAAEVDAVANL